MVLSVYHMGQFAVVRSMLLLIQRLLEFAEVQITVTTWGCAYRREGSNGELAFAYLSGTCLGRTSRTETTLEQSR